MIVHMNGLDIPNKRKGFTPSARGKEAHISAWESKAHGHYFKGIGSFYDIIAISF